MKQGSATANTLGTLAVMYSGFGVLLSWARGEDDEVNTILAGTATGLLYKSSGKKKTDLQDVSFISNANNFFSWIKKVCYGRWSRFSTFRNVLYLGSSRI